MTIFQESVVWGDEPANIQLRQYFNLYPDIKLFIDIPGSYGVENNVIFKTYAQTYDVSQCSTDIRMKTVLYNSCGSLTFKLIHEDCQRLFKSGARVRLYLDNRCWFCGWIFTTKHGGKADMQVTCFDWLRYFKVPLTYGKSQLKTEDGTQGLPASDIFKKICQDLAIPFDVYTNSITPVPAQNYSQKTAFQILEFAINQTLINSDEDNRKYFMYMHETNFEDDYGKDFQDTTLFKTSGNLTWYCRNTMTVDTLIDDEMLCDYDFEESIDKQTYNEIIVYKDNKTYLSKTGKTLKQGKKTGTQTKKVANDNVHKGLYGYLPYYHKAPDGYTEAQMQKVADNLLKVFDRPTNELNLKCYGVVGMRAGYLVPVAIRDIAGTSIGVKVKNEKTGEEELKPVYRTVEQCEMIIEHPLKMNLKLSSGVFNEVT